MPVVGIEPSCLLTFNDEFKALKGIENRDKLKNKFYLIEEFILEQIKEVNKVSAHAYNKNVLVHGHCHQKSHLHDTLLLVVWFMFLIIFYISFVIENIISTC